MEKLEQFSNKIEELTNLVFHSIIKIDQKKDDQPRAFCYTLALKTNNGLNTANLLIKQITLKPHYCDSLFLLLRTMLSDAITHFYLLTISQNENNNDDILIGEIKEFEFDHLKFTYDNLDIYQKLYGESAIEIEQKKNDLRLQYPEYFNGVKKNRVPGVKKMVSIIIDSKLDYAIKAVTIPFELYDKFSKYEHLGMPTQHLVTRQFKDDNLKQILGEIYTAVKSIILLLDSLLMPFFTIEEKIGFESLFQEIQSIVIYELE